MARVHIRLPSLLATLLEDRREIQLEAPTLQGALNALVDRHPSLKVHLFDESGSLRRHVLCFVNQTNTRWLKDSSIPLRDDDVITILQAVTGG